MKVLVVAEFYPRQADPALGIWAHRQALAARDHGAEVRVVVLHRPIAPASRFTDPSAWRELMGQPRRVQLDGLDVRYLRFVSPPRGRSYASWGALNLRDEGQRVSLLSMLFRAPLRFLQLYFLRLGFLDGVPGLHVCAYTAFYTFMKQARLWELEWARHQPDPESDHPTTLEWTRFAGEEAAQRAGMKKSLRAA